MNNSQWFKKHLEASANGFIWAVRQVPAERLYLRPPAVLGEWSAARHVFHLFFYERTFALPSMRQWLGGPGLSRQELMKLDEDAAWNSGHEFDTLQRQFQEGRQAQIALLSELSEEAWDERLLTVWGPMTLHWVVSKTYQHTMDHTNTVLSMVLFWDFV